MAAATALSVLLAVLLFKFKACGASSLMDSHGGNIRKLQAFKASLLEAEASSPISPSPAYSPPHEVTAKSPCVYRVTSYGADPTGKQDSTEALLRAFSDASRGPSDGFLMAGVSNHGGSQIDLEGGNYLVSRPLRFPAPGIGNIMIYGGTLHASPNFPSDGYLIDLSASSSDKDEDNKTSSSTSSYNFEFITFSDLLLDCNYRGGGIAIINSLRIGIHNCYVAHFATNGILVQSGHEILIQDSFLGQHITAGNDPGERNFYGTAINLAGNDNVVSDVVIFSAAIGILVSGQANLITGVHCYNKATGFGGTGIYLKLPGLTQTRIVNSYMDYTGIVAEDPVQLVISNNFFLGDAFVSLKSINGVADGVNIVDNIFSGSGRGIDIVQLDQSSGPFVEIGQVSIDRNSARGMNAKATIARAVLHGNGSSWTADFNGVLLFPNLIRHVQYSISTNGTGFPKHALRKVSDNRVVIESDVAAPMSVYVVVDQERSA
ncbi:hypothetical protein Nepgr_027863 [Nepenthes gracilis]|uniref:Polygalacturonase QRT3 n=1 Tax=Nepenthes gracilis TaxID=150966 RepID=A0AAD3TAM1_NEPGR|nr:hypothetical protein Nepgr_027863 [Nepenthes gracilis]